jgi:hypothetical protein
LHFQLYVLEMDVDDFSCPLLISCGVHTYIVEFGVAGLYVLDGYVVQFRHFDIVNDCVVQCRSV